MSSRDEGFASHLMTFNWAVSKKHNYEQAYPSGEMELYPLLTCDAISQLKTYTAYDNPTFRKV
jgi:hypothetical protein